MATIKTFSLYIALLSSCNLFTMQHEYLALSSDIDISGLKDIVLSKFWHKRKVQNPALNDVWDKVDREYMGIDDCVMNVGWSLRSLVGTYLSYYKGCQIKSKAARDQLKQIEEWIKDATVLENNQCDLFKKLVADHWYVNYLIKSLVNGNIEGVTGFTIDDVCSKCENIDKNSMSSIVFFDEYKIFFENNLSNKKLTDIMPKVVSDIHFTVLYHPRGNIKPNSLRMCSNGKYLEATDEGNAPCAWEMETGKIVDIFEINVDHWIPGKTEAQEAVCGVYSCAEMDRYRVIDVNDHYCARVSDSYVSIDPEFFSKKDQNNPKAIILFKKPQKTSYLCQKAFDNSYGNSKELQALRDSKGLKSLEGFPRENLESIIDNHMKQVVACDRILAGK